MTSEQIAQIEAKISYKFNDKDLLVRAFTHSSFAKERNVSDNERMEFFGDSILDMVVSEYLMRKYDGCEVGALSAMRANVVSADGLRPVVQNLDVMKYLQLGGSATNIVSDSEKIESNLYEAIVCAIYLDGGFEFAKQFILDTLSQSMNKLETAEHNDCKSLLNWYCQKNRKTVRYIKVEKSGADNRPTFKVDLYIGDEYMCSGEGRRLKSAEQDAAKKLVTKWRIDSALS